MLVLPDLRRVGHAIAQFGDALLHCVQPLFGCTQLLGEVGDGAVVLVSVNRKDHSLILGSLEVGWRVRVLLLVCSGATFRKLP